MTTILETERLILREFTLEDLEAFFALVTDPEVTRYTGDLEQRPYQRSMERRTLVQRNLSRLK